MGDATAAGRWVMSRSIIKWLDAMLKKASEGVENDRYISKLLAGGNFAKMLRVMAGEYSGIGGQCVNAQHANQCKRVALLKAAEVVEENAKLRDQLRWRDAYGEPPTEEGIYLVINNDFDGGTSIHATYWKGKWPIEFTVANWRPIGPLPGGE
jgi:hypothetical protein